jgi:hypothetical protein
MMKAYMYGPVKEPKVIKMSTINLYPGMDVDVDPETIVIIPGLTANGEPTSNSTQTIPYSQINEDDNYGYIVTITGVDDYFQEPSVAELRAGDWPDILVFDFGSDSMILRENGVDVYNGQISVDESPMTIHGGIIRQDDGWRFGYDPEANIEYYLSMPSPSWYEMTKTVTFVVIDFDGFEPPTDQKSVLTCFGDPNDNAGRMYWAMIRQLTNAYMQTKNEYATVNWDHAHPDPDLIHGKHRRKRTAVEAIGYLRFVDYWGGRGVEFGAQQRSHNYGPISSKPTNFPLLEIGHLINTTPANLWGGRHTVDQLIILSSPTSPTNKNIPTVSYQIPGFSEQIFWEGDVLNNSHRSGKGFLSYPPGGPDIPYVEPPFDPSFNSWQIHWWDASNTASVIDTTDAGFCEEIKDSGRAQVSWSPQHLKQTTLAAKPATGTRTHNGLNVLDFDGVDDFMSNTTLDHPTNNIYFGFVVVIDELGELDESVMSIIEANTNDYQLQSNGSIVTGNNAPFVTIDANNGPYFPGLHFFELNCDGIADLASLYIDEELVGQVAFPGANPNFELDVAFNLFTDQTGTKFLNGAFCEGFIVRRYADPEGLLRFRNYVSEKWGAYGGWLPSNYDDVTNWWDASDANTVNESVENVIWRLEDKISINHLEAQEVSPRPATGTRTQNGLNVIDFDGVDDYLRTETFIPHSNGDFYVGLVAIIDPQTTQDEFDSLWSYNTGPLDYQIDAGTSSPGNWGGRVSTNGLQDVDPFSGGPYDDGVCRFLELVGDIGANSLSVHIDGILVGQSNNFNGMEEAGGIAGIFMNRSNNRSLKGAFCEGWLANSAPTDNVLKFFRKYSADKWGTQNLEWDPSMLSQTLYWWDADDASSIIQSNNRVSSWTDRVSNTAVLQSNTSHQPLTNVIKTVNNNNMVYFDDGTIKFMESGGGVRFPTTAHVFWVGDIYLQPGVNDAAILSWGDEDLPTFVGGWILGGPQAWKSTTDRWLGAMTDVNSQPITWPWNNVIPPIGFTGPRLLEFSNDPVEGTTRAYEDGDEAGKSGSNVYDPDSWAVGWLTDEGTYGDYWKMNFGSTFGSGASSPQLITPYSQVIVCDGILTGVDLINMRNFCLNKLGL